MVSESNKNQLDSLEREVRELKAQLSAINDEKEGLFQKKHELSSQISSLVREVRESREKRNNLTSSVKEGKVKRDDLNKVIKDKIEIVKDLQKKKDELVKRLDIKGDPILLKKRIDAIDTKIETEAPTFEKEKELMKVLKDLKKQYDSQKGVAVLVEEISKISKEIDGLKNQANSEHRTVQSSANQSQEKHTHMLESAKGIDALRAKESEFDAQILEKKSKLKELSDVLEGKLTEISKIAGVEHKAKEERRAMSKDALKKRLIDKQNEVSEKLKNRKTLTTEDILVLQGMDFEDDLPKEKAE